jgi:hypothetical protein
MIYIGAGDGALYALNNDTNERSNIHIYLLPSRCSSNPGGFPGSS